MITVPKSAATSNSLSNSTDFSILAQEIEWHLEEGYLYPSQGLKNTLEDLKRRAAGQVPGVDREVAKSELHDQEIVSDMAELIESFPSILRRAHVANQLKQDVKYTEGQIDEALFTLQNVLHNDIPSEVTIDIQGDVVPVSVTLEDRQVELKLVSYADGEATYAVR